MGHVCEFFYHDEAPRKFGICVDADDLAFLLINRKRYIPATDIPVDSHEIEWLTQDSYIETGEIRYVYERDLRTIDGRIGGGLREEICQAMERHGALPPRLMNPIVANLRGSGCSGRR